MIKNLLLVSAGLLLLPVILLAPAGQPASSAPRSHQDKRSAQAPAQSEQVHFAPLVASEGHFRFDCPGLLETAGANYFVSTTGSDEVGLGTAAQPWRSISYAMTLIEDGSTVWVGAGLYRGQVELTGIFKQGVTVRACHPYQTRLRNANSVDQVVVCFTCQGVTFEGFDIAHAIDGTGGAGIYVLQVQDLLQYEGDGAEHVENVTIRNNIFHDSYNNDLIKINRGARNILVEDNLFYNQQGLDSHIDLNGVFNVVVRHNIFFNDFAGSGRVDGGDTGSFVVIKDSNGERDGIVGAYDISIDGNLFFNWEGEPTGNGFISIGEDRKPYFQAYDVLVENNLLLGNSAELMRAPFLVRGSRDITFRHNTVSGNLPSYAYGFRLAKHTENPPNQNITFYNNIWSDPSGTMGSEDVKDWVETDFSDSEPGDTASFTLANNLYWNGDTPIYVDTEELVNIDDDPKPIMADPELPDPDGIPAPRWLPAEGEFADGSTSIDALFLTLVMRYGVPAAEPGAIERADPAFSPGVDIFGNPRSPDNPTLGAIERTARH